MKLPYGVYIYIYVYIVNNKDVVSSLFSNNQG